MISCIHCDEKDGQIMTLTASCDVLRDALADTRQLVSHRDAEIERLKAEFYLLRTDLTRECDELNEAYKVLQGDAEALRMRLSKAFVGTVENWNDFRGNLVCVPDTWGKGCRVLILHTREEPTP